MNKASTESGNLKNEPLAIIGIGCRFPGGAGSPGTYWKMLLEGTDAVTEVPPDRWDVDAWVDSDPDTPEKMCCKHGSFVDDVRMFDAEFFNISPREATLMDPQQRLLLETGWEALENAGVAANRLTGSRAGVFVGISTNDYSEVIAGEMGATGNASAGTGNSAAIAAGRISHFLGLTGPAVAIDTACSSSLMAVHLACQSLRNNECELALAGGVNLMLTPTVTGNLDQAGRLSQQGVCRTFDASADGYVRGEGAGMVALKRLSDAQKHGDPIVAVVRATASNQNGQRSELTDSKGTAQQELIARTLESAGLTPADIDYVETHGIGIARDDQSELEALGSVFGGARDGAEPLRIGSVKTNIGNLEAAAGIAGLIKTALALQREEIPPHLHFVEPSRLVDWGDNSLCVPTEPTAWSRGERRRIAGVSSFGLSGTNAHLLLEEAPAEVRAEPEWSRPRHLLALSARNEEGLHQVIAEFETCLQDLPDQDFADACYTAGFGRSKFDCRLALPASNREEAIKTFGLILAGKRAPGAIRNELRGEEPVPVAFLFTGQGSQSEGMGRELYETNPVFRCALDRCDELLRDHLEHPLLSVIYPESDGAGLLNETAYTQPALFSMEYALAEMWKGWGVAPAMVMGHSVGEYVAACTAGVFSLEDGIKLIAARGRLMQALPRGGEMVALGVEAGRVAPLLQGLEDNVSIAAVNSPSQVVLSGEGDALRQVVAGLDDESIRTTWLTVSHAFHSPRMNPMLEAFGEICSSVTFSPPKLTLISNVSGAVAGPEIQTPEYWTRHVRDAVLFASGVEAVVAAGAAIMLEVGPKPILSGLGQQCVDDPDLAWLPTIRGKADDWTPVLKSLGELFTRGIPVDFEAFDNGYGRRRVVLPTYPFQRRRFWADMATGSAQSSSPMPGDSVSVSAG